MKTAVGKFVARRLDPEERYGLRATLFAFAVALVGVPFGLLLNQVMSKGRLVHIDVSAARALNRGVRGHPALITFLKVLTFIGTPQFLTSVVIVGSIFLWRRHRYRLMAFLIVTSAAGGIIDSIVKILVNRPRPNLANPLIPLHGKSFPSGHVMSSTIVYGALLLIFFPAIPKRRRALWIGVVLVLVAAIGVSRLALGVHYITDVVGGFILGLAWLTASTAAFSIWRKERGRKPVDPLRGLEPEAKRTLSPKH
jgi:undecaprenyl-diphosphatase